MHWAHPHAGSKVRSSIVSRPLRHFLCYFCLREKKICISCTESGFIKVRDIFFFITPLLCVEEVEEKEGAERSGARFWSGRWTATGEIMYIKQVKWMELLTAKLHAKANAEVVIVNIRLIYTYTYIFLPELYIVYIYVNFPNALI